MPKSLDTTDRIVFVLASDADKAKDVQPRLIGQVLTLGRQRKLMAAVKQMQQAEDPEAKTNAALDAVVVCLSGWENFGREFSREAIEDLLTIGEITEIINAIITTFTADGDDLKKSESPRPSAAANSASLVVDHVESYSAGNSQSRSSVPSVMAMVANGVSVDLTN